MVAHQANFLRQLGAIFILIGVFALQGGVSAGTSNVNTSARSGNAIPSISNIQINGNNPIVLTANTTTQVSVSFTVSDNNGCGDVLFNGGVSSTLYRSSSGPACSFSYNNCYILSGVTSHSCPDASSTNLSANVTTTFSVYYFADATDASSSYSAQDWRFYVDAKDAKSSSSPTSTPTGVELNTLSATELATTTIDYGALSAGSDTGSTNQELPIINVGNSSTSIQISGTGLRKGSDTVPTSSQHYATGTFAFGGTEQLLSSVATAVSGWLTNHGPQIRSWQNTTPLPSLLAGGAAFSVYSRNAYFIGGATTTVLFAKVNSTGSIGAWTNTSALPGGDGGAYQYHRSAVYNDYLYSLGGGNTSSVSFAPINSTGSLGVWQNTVSFSSPIRWGYSFARNGYLYYLGGNDQSGPATSTVQYASINATGSIGAWTNTSPLPFTVAENWGVVVGDKIYLAGGCTSYFIGCGSRTSTILYATINSTGSISSWQVAGRLPVALTNLGLAYNSGFIYVLGGNDGSDATSSVSVASLRSDNTIGEWQSVTSFASKLEDTGATYYGGYLYTFGGVPGPTTTVSYVRLNSQSLYWGMELPPGTPGGDYYGTTTITTVFSP